MRHFFAVLVLSLTAASAFAQARTIDEFIASDPMVQAAIQDPSQDILILATGDTESPWVFALAPRFVAADGNLGSARRRTSLQPLQQCQIGSFTGVLMFNMVKVCGASTPQNVCVKQQPASTVIGHCGDYMCAVGLFSDSANALWVDANHAGVAATSCEQ